MSLPNPLLISGLLDGYRARRFSPVDVMEQVLASIARAPDRRVWITRLARDRVLGFARALAARAPEALPLYGVPFAIKDNIDLGGMPTTAGCPDYAYTPGESAYVVRKLIEAGAIPLGKTNLDQFATGLVGTRSPHGACQNSFDSAYISGGSSSGSAVSVATGLVSFSLGTDTAGSGRVPAAFNNIVGLKPTCGALSTSGVVPACRSLDCVSIFALTADDAARVYAVAAGFDPDDPYSKAVSLRGLAATGPLAALGFRFGVPRADQLEFFGDSEYAHLFEAAVTRLEALGGRRVEIDFDPFRATARLLYEGPWVAERYCAVGDFLERQPQSMHPITRQIISGGRNATAADAFRSQYRLMELRRAADRVWSTIDVLVTPTAGTVYRIEAVDADPIRLNSNLGYYTNFVNLLDLAAVAVPAGFRSDGLPFGLTLVGRAGADADLLFLADKVHRAKPTSLGALGLDLPAHVATDYASGVVPTPGPQAATSKALEGSFNSRATAKVDTKDSRVASTDILSADDRIAVAVCGAHMEGLPLNHQLTSRGAFLIRRTRTAPAYKFYALPGGPPDRPGLVRVASGGAPIELEVWSVPSASFGSFVAGIPAPLGIGKVELENGEQVAGFVCESYATATAADITGLGSWRRYLG
ncbi:MAG: allophanate hydrolase [Gammaproteobacteria bacterium]|nr:allophanate hydrolase [Gammaproteobacteria bacterium]